MRAVLTIVCSLALVGFLSAEDKPKAVKLEGNVCCAKCELGKADKCMTVVVVKKGDKEDLYYFDKESNSKYHKDYCQGSTAAKVEGKVVEKDGKMMITVTKIEKKD
jgi:hypothetical protein